MLQKVKTLTNHVQTIQRVSHQPVGVSWAHDAIHEATLEVERIAPSDLVAMYARQVRDELKGLDAVPGIASRRIYETPVGEKIALLERHVAFLQEQSALEGDGVRTR